MTPPSRDRLDISTDELKRRRALVVKEVEHYSRQLRLAQSRLEVLNALIVDSEYD